MCGVSLSPIRSAYRTTHRTFTESPSRGAQNGTRRSVLDDRPSSRRAAPDCPLGHVYAARVLASVDGGGRGDARLVMAWLDLGMMLGGPDDVFDLWDTRGCTSSGVVLVARGAGVGRLLGRLQRSDPRGVHAGPASVRDVVCRTTGGVVRRASCGHRSVRPPPRNGGASSSHDLSTSLHDRLLLPVRRTRGLHREVAGGACPSPETRLRIACHRIGSQ